MDASGSSLILERLGAGVARVTLNRPEVRNAINHELAVALDRVVKETEADGSIRVTILTGGGGRAFCAGADLSAMAFNREGELWTPDGGFAGFVTARRTKAWIAAVGGFAFAGGCEIALACDLVVASDNAAFGLPEVKRGLIAAAGGLVRLPRAIPRAVAAEMILTGNAIDANRAQALGLVNRVVSQEHLDAEALALARQIAANAPLAVDESLALLKLASDEIEADLLRSSDAALVRVRASEDMREGARAFLEKRPPRWTGR